MLRRLLLLLLLPAALTAAQAPGFTAQDAAREARRLVVPAADRQQVLEHLIAQIHNNYINPETADRMIDILRSNMKDSAYDGEFDGNRFAAHLTDDLQAISKDKHLRVGYTPGVLPTEDAAPTSEDRAAYQNELDNSNCGFDALAILPGNIGYVQMSYFAEPASCESTAATAMKFVSHARALVFDLRQNRGGDPRMVALLESYLFDHPVHVNNIYSRRDGKTTEYWTTPSKLALRMPSQPVYILSSRFTFSAAEQFCYDLKGLGRAIVVGERTGGAAHPVRNHRLGDHFFISMPEYRYISPLTNSDWEGVGIMPDVLTPPQNAVLVAEHVIQERSPGAAASAKTIAATH